MLGRNEGDPWIGQCLRRDLHIAADSVLHPHDFGVVTAFNANSNGKVEAYRLTYIDNNGPDAYYNFPAEKLRQEKGCRFHSIPQDVAYQIATEGIKGNDGDVFVNSERHQVAVTRWKSNKSNGSPPSGHISNAGFFT